MIHELDAGIEQLLQGSISGRVKISFEQPNKEWVQSSRQSWPMLNLFLFDIRENNMLRQHQWQTVANGNGNGRSYKQRTPYRFDCHYLLTAWAKKMADQHRLLSEAMTVLLQNPNLPKDVLVGSLKTQPFDIQTRVGSHDKLTNPAELWSAIENDIRASVSYIVTIAVNPWDKEQKAPSVQTKRLRVQQRSRPETSVETVEVAGKVGSKHPLPDNLLVTLESDQWRYEGVVDEDGRFAVNFVLPGRYTLTGWQLNDTTAAEKLAEKTVIVPPSVQILALADTFQMQVGTAPRLQNLHLKRRRPGFVEKVTIAEFSIESVGERMPLSGTYYFGRTEEGKITAVIPTSVANEKSFELVYKKPKTDIGNYDLTI